MAPLDAGKNAMLMRYAALFFNLPVRRPGALASAVIAAWIAAFFLPAAAEADGLSEDIAALFTQAMRFPPQARPVLQVTLLTPPAQLATLCPAPALALSGGLSRLAGLHSVIAQCGAQHHFLQVNLTVTASWWQAAGPIAPGQILRAEQIRAQRGSLAHAPGGLIFDPQRIIGRVAQRAIRPGEALVESQLRQQRAIRAGEKVEMIYNGDGFCIRAAGKALDNGALHQRVRIQTPSGEIITATAVAPGQARVTAD